MNRLPDFNGPGCSYSQPNIRNPNTIQAVPIFNSQIPQPYNFQPLSQPTTEITAPYYYRMTSTSDDGNDETEINENPWQKVKNIKRRKVSGNNSQNIITTTNKYSQLGEDNVDATATVDNQNRDKVQKPPPIFIYGVINYEEMAKKIREIAEEEQYTTKTLADNTIKINCGHPDTYRKLVHFMRENNIIHHTYQPKEERAYRVVIKHLHHTTNVQDIKSELSKEGHTVRNIINARSRLTKEALNLFFVDIEPADNNKEIYKIRGILNRTIEIEPPKRTKGIVQCMRCQQYGHTKTYCNKPYTCVKCGGSHSTESCKKTKDTPAKCALCGGPHPANYRGCEFYHRLLNRSHNTNNRLNLQYTANETINMQSTNRRPQMPTNLSSSKTYANALNASRNQQQDESTSITIMNKFLEEFRAMFQQLIQQNSMVLNMLTALINKIH